MKTLHSFCVRAIFLIFSVGLASCAGEGDKDLQIMQAEEENGTNGKSSSQNLEKVKNIFVALPSPMETATLLKKTGSSYNASILNDIKNVSKYNTARSRALNLGIYGTDLSYTSIYNQNQESIIYLTCAKQLADDLGVTKAFDEETMERMEENIENRDSMMTIISDTYYTLDAYLKENNRDNISAMVITGGWVEGLYIAVAVSEYVEHKNEELRTRIAEQKSSLNQLLALVENYNRNNELNDLLGDLNNIKTTFDKIQITKEEPSNAEGSNVIGKKTTYNISDEILLELSEKVKEIRSNYTSI